jgi:hypothetical protein
MARYRDGGPSQEETMMSVSKPPPMGERLRASKWLAMKSRLPKRMVLPREKPLQHKRSPPAAIASAYGGTIGTSRGKARCKSPFLMCQLSVFFAPARYTVVKITCSCFEVVL